MTKNSPARLGMKIVILAVALVGVFFFMAQLRSNVAEDPLAMLIGSDVGRPMNWCPADVQSLEIDGESHEKVTDPVQIQSYCQILAESFDSTKLNLQSFKPILKAVGNTGAPLVVEADASGKIFRFQGLPFGSKQLTRQLEKKIQR
jgi:hypothetical protein